MKTLFILWKLWIERAWCIFGIPALFFGLIGLPNNALYKFAIIVASLMLSVIVSAIWTLSKKKSVRISIDGQTELTVQYGNLWANKGAIVIPVNDYFDTHVGNGIVSERTLHGQFIRDVYGNNEKSLREDIDEAIRQRSLKQIGITPRRGEGLPTTRYDIGSCIRIYHGNKLFILVVTSRFDKNNHAELNSSEYPMLLNGLYRGIFDLNDDNPVFIPLIGSGQAGTGCTPMKLLSAMVSHALFADKLTIHNGINIVLNENANVNLGIIDYLYNTINLNKVQ